MNKQDLKDFTNVLGKVALLAAGYIFKDKLVKAVTNICVGPVSYNDTVDAIIDSSAFSDSKKEMLALLKRNQSDDYYRSIIKIVESSTFSDSKIEMIEILNEEWT